jgi:hypothetical protein
MEQIKMMGRPTLDQPIVKAKIERVVNRGSDWLDKVYPEFYSKVDVATFQIVSVANCVWGIIGYETLKQNGYLQAHALWGSDFMYDHGFTLPRSLQGVADWPLWEYLQECWVQAILERQLVTFTEQFVKEQANAYA